MGIATDLIFISIAAILGGLAAHALRQPLIFGYILAGVIVGPYTGGITVQNIDEIEKLAEVGVALLLFTIGLDFSFGELKRMSRIAFFATPIQIILCACAGYFISLGLGLRHSDAIWIGAAISLSSTMVVIKTLTARDAMDTQSGRTMLTILIVQDLALLPIMLLLPQLTSDTVSFGPVLIALAKAASFLVFMYFSGAYVFPRLFNLVTKQGSRELFFLFTLTFAFGAGFLAHEMGLSFALGAFVAGMILSETEFNHQALSDVSSLRDLFALIFFVSIGMLFDPAFFISHMSTVLMLALAVVVSNATITAGTMRLFGFNAIFSWTIGIGLSQVGEFAFVIAKAGRSSGTLSPDSFSLMITVTVISMVATPALLYLGEKILHDFQPGTDPEKGEIPVALSHHVIIIGGGVVGQYVAHALTTFERPYIVIENDLRAVLEMRERNIRVLYGDASCPPILGAAGLKRASLVVITTTNDKILPPIVEEIKETRADIPVVVRVEEVDDIEMLSSLKVEEIVQPQLEVGLEMVRHSLLSLGIDVSRVSAILGQLRAERYEPMRH